MTDVPKRRQQAGDRASVGAPTRYDPSINELVTDYCMLGATIAELAELLEVATSTIINWMRRHPEFKEAVAAGREKADARVARSLYRRAIGYSHDDVHVSNFQGQITITRIVKHYPPDTAAAFIWLQNRQPDKWRREQPAGRDMSPEQIALVAQQAIAQAMAVDGAPATE